MDWILLLILVLAAVAGGLVSAPVAYYIGRRDVYHDYERGIDDGDFVLDAEVLEERKRCI